MKSGIFNRLFGALNVDLEIILDNKNRQTLPKKKWENFTGILLKYVNMIDILF